MSRGAFLPSWHLRDKQVVAFTSVVAAIALTVLKLAVGLLTGSLGILAEAAHSALDLVAALTTLFAVRIADRPADESHPYGHGRFENLAALFETALLLGTCAWVVSEAVARLDSGEHHVAPSIWAYGVMVVSIVVDWSRSRALYAAAREHESQALEADALHFSTDIWSSAVVIVGLAAVQVSQARPDIAFLAGADTVAAVGVALIVAAVSARLGLQTIAALTDRAPPGLVEDVLGAARNADGVLGARQARLRRAGNKLFVDLVVAVGRTSTFADAHAVADRVENAVQKQVPNADVVVHVEPVADPAESAADQVDFVARQRGMRVHDVRVRDVGDKLEVDLHVELDPAMPLAKAHAAADALERDVLAANRRFGVVNTHLEAPVEKITRDEEITGVSNELIAAVTGIADRLAGPGATHEVRVYQSRDLRNLVIHATFGADVQLERVHELSAQIERALRAELERIGTVLVHAEPHE
jgi:cation diffusion facilitator family transporter